MKKAKLFSLKYWFYDFCFLTGAFFGLIYFRPKWIYENEKARQRIKSGALVIGNHNSYFDPVYMMAAIYYRRHHFVCKQEFLQSKARFFFKNFLCIGIDNENPTIGSFKEIVNHLKSGELVTIFPEGRIIEEDNLQKFKSGFALMAVKANVSIIPVYVKKRENKLQRLVLAIGEPIDVSQYRHDMSKINQLAEVLHQKEEKLALLTKGE